MSASSEDSDDEDVILPGSPLYEYFKEPSPKSENISTSRKWRLFSRIVTPKFVLYIIKSSFNVSKSALQALTSSVNNLLRSQHDRVQERTLQNMLSVVTKESIMIPEDVAFLENFCSVGNSRYFEGDKLLKWLPIVPALGSSIFLFVFVYGSCGSGYYHPFDEPHAFWILLRKILFFVAAFNTSFFGWYTVLCIYHRFKSRSIDKSVKRLCCNVKELIDNFKRCFRTIQEVELIARGFTSVGVASVVQRLELSNLLAVTSTSRQLPGLRKLLFSWMKCTFYEYRRSTLDLIAFFPIATDSLAGYFATMNIKEFGSLLKYNVGDPEEFQELLKVSDNLSLSSIKAIHQLMQVQVSEFLRRLCLGFLDENAAVNYMVTFENINKISFILNRLHVQDSHILSLARQAYSYYQSVEKSNSVPQNHCYRAVTKKSCHKQLQSMVHDLNLHVKAVLMRIAAVEDFLAEENPVVNDDQEMKINVELTEKLNASFKGIKTELLSCDEYFEECSSYVTNLMNKGENKRADLNDLAISSVQNVKSSDRDVQAPIFVCDADPVIQDEVYEAVVEDWDQDGSKSSLCDNVAADVEKLDKKATLHLMKELKTVLLVKAEEHRCREEKALRAKETKEGKESEVNKKEKEHADCNSCAENGNSGENSVVRCVNEEEKLENLRMKSHMLNPTVKSYKFQNECDTANNTNASNEEINEPKQLAFAFRPVMHKDFAASIAALAAERQKLLNLKGEIEFGDEVIDDSD